LKDLRVLAEGSEGDEKAFDDLVQKGDEVKTRFLELRDETIARKLRTKKSAISRIENHAEDIRLSTLEKYANALGRKIRVHLTD
jgi:transcriptional regulator with XRE-family HTH domain